MTGGVPISDEAQARALEKSIRLAGRVLAFAGALFCLWVVLSGTYWVDEGTVAVHLRFGEIIGRGNNGVIKPGGPYPAFPEPVDRIVIVPTALQRISLEDGFWCGRGSRDGLRPGEDGSLLTGDLNIVHGRWQVMFRIPPEGDGAIRFVRSLGDMNRASLLVKSAAERAVVSVVGRTGVDDFTRGNIDEREMTILAQRFLDDLDCGLEILDMSRSAPPQYPFQAMDAFMAVNEAESAKLKAIENAWKERENMLNRVAGILHRELTEAIEVYDGEGLSVKKEIDALLDDDRLGGDASVLMQDARLYRTEVVEKIRGRSELFSKLLPTWLTDEKSLCGRLFWETWQEILSGNVNAYYLPRSGKKTIYLHLQDSMNGF